MVKKKITLNYEHTLDDLTSVGKTIMPLAKQLLGAGGMMQVEILSAWADIIGEDMAQYTLPQKIKFGKNERSGGILELMVLSGACAMEVKQRESQILEKINTYFGYEAINKLKIIQNSCPDNFLISKKSIENVKKNLVSDEEQNYITEVVKDISNDELRQRLENLGKAVFSNKKS